MHIQNSHRNPTTAKYYKLAVAIDNEAEMCVILATGWARFPQEAAIPPDWPPWLRMQHAYCWPWAEWSSSWGSARISVFWWLDCSPQGIWTWAGSLSFPSALPARVGLPRSTQCFPTWWTWRWGECRRACLCPLRSGFEWFPVVKARRNVTCVHALNSQLVYTLGLRFLFLLKLPLFEKK